MWDKKESGAPRAGLRATGALAVAAITVWTFALSLRVPLLSHLRLIGGDTLDGSLALAIQLHWSNVLRGAALAWNTTDYFYPIKDTLGYNEGFLISGVILAFWRALGADAFLGLFLVDVTYKVVGFVSLAGLARRWLHLPVVFCALAGALYISANGYYLATAVHSQFLTCFLLPLLLLLQLEIVRAAASRRIVRFSALTAAFAVLFGAQLLTSFYIAYFFLLAAIVTCVIWAIYSLATIPLRTILMTVRPLVTFALAEAAAIVICAIPFLLVYLPKARETGMHTLADMIPYALRPTDIVNVGPFNLLWSRVYQVTAGRLVPDWQNIAELEIGPTPLLFAVFLLAGIPLLRDRNGWRRQMLAAMWCANLLLLIVFIRWPHGRWIWASIYRFIPGAAATRVSSRLELVLYLPLVLIATTSLAAMWRKPASRVAVGLLVLLLLVEQVNDFPIFQTDRIAEVAYYAGFPAPPAACGAFYAENSRPGPDVLTLYRHNVDAMVLAELRAIPTVNGFATFQPPGWNLIHPDQPAYREAVHTWLATHPVAGKVCGVDFINRQWQVPGP